MISQVVVLLKNIDVYLQPSDERFIFLSMFSSFMGRHAFTLSKPPNISLEYFAGGFSGGHGRAVGPWSHPSPVGHRSAMPVGFPQQPQSLPSSMGDVQGTGQGTDGRCTMDVLFTEEGYVSGVLSFLCTG